jgi:microcystin-dependent protein
MTYQVNFTESTNPAKPAITVDDGQLNQQTNLTFVGKNYAGYAKYIAENFLHLLENFARNTPPGTLSGEGSPIEGQLWYDNSTGVNLLKIYDGAEWTAAGAVKKAASAPVIANSNAGDLWVNTATAQLYVFSGSNWLLVGPQFSSGKLTGPTVDEIIDTSNVTHSVISFYANNSLIAIISKETFTPKSTVTGFATINQGFNLSTVDATNTSDLSRIWGTASKADALLVNGQTVDASNFLTTNGVTNTTNFALSVRNDGGITIGANLSFNIYSDSASNTVLYNKASGKPINFRLTEGNTPTTVLHVGANSRVGIGVDNISPASTLDVAGLITSSLGINILTSSPSSITTSGGIVTGAASAFGGNLSVTGQLTVEKLDSLGDPQAGSVILPSTDGIYDIGSETQMFRNVFAQSFVGDFSGTFTGQLEGSISGSAARLASPTVFSLQGDVSSDPVSFTGQSTFGTAVFNTTISQNFISSKDAATDTIASDQLLIFRQGNSNLYRTTKETFLKQVATVPPGVIFPFAGTVLPPGYLLCDGSEVKTSDYPLLYSVIGYAHKSVLELQGFGTFALPDLRGKFALGRDNMNNGIYVPSKDDPGIQIAGQPATAANSVTDISADIVGKGTGSQTITLSVSNLPDHKHNLSSASAQYYAAGTPGAPADVDAVAGFGMPSFSSGSGLPNSGSLIAGTTGTAINVMNPYTTINYIIFTGVL